LQWAQFVSPLPVSSTGSNLALRKTIPAPDRQTLKKRPSGRFFFFEQKSTALISRPCLFRVASLHFPALSQMEDAIPRARVQGLSRHKTLVSSGVACQSLRFALRHTVHTDPLAFIPRCLERCARGRLWQTGSMRSMSLPNA
jgi:hypothetical protein